MDGQNLSPPPEDQAIERRRRRVGREPANRPEPRSSAGRTFYRALQADPRLLARDRDQQELRVLVTPDRRYLVVRGRLWRTANPRLAEDLRSALVSELMSARRAVRAAKGDPTELACARSRVDAAKHGLGERGPVWWHDSAPDYGRRLARNTPYADWFATLSEE